jgi:sugar phosphate isomerase/epimerase
MLIGAMNHPARDVFEEIEWMAAMGLEFIDLTLEPPAAASWKVDPRAVRDALEKHGLEVVGHTAFYLPIASAIEDIRKAAVCELRRCLEVFSAVGVRSMNVHPDRYTPMHDRAFYISRDIESLRELMTYGKSLGVGLMIENLPGDFNNAAQLGELLEPLPELGLHLDIGHANLMVGRNTTEEILTAHGKRLRHVHLHDNRGGHEDLHLPLGAGNLDLKQALRALKQCGYDGTITLEVFSPDRRHLQYSRDLLRETWDSISLS